MVGKTYTVMQTSVRKGESDKQDKHHKYKQRIEKAHIWFRMIQVERKNRQKSPG